MNNDELKKRIEKLEDILDQLKGYHKLDKAILKINNDYDSGVFDMYQKMKEQYIKNNMPVERIETQRSDKNVRVM